MTKILLVCKANICRSPMACAIARQMTDDAGRAAALEFDSAGVHAQRVGQRIDARAKEALLTRHYKPPSTRSRPICEKDFQSFDLILAMDESNLRALARQCPPVYQAKLGLFLSFAPQCGATEVPDPYYGNMAGFVRVIDLCEAATRALLAMELAGRCVGVGEKRIG